MDTELMFKIQEANQRSQNLDEQSKVVDQQIIELNKFSDAINSLEENNEREILASVGKGVYIKSELKENELFVEVGSGVLVKKTPKEAREIVKDQISKLHNMKIQLNTEINALNSEVEDLLDKVQKQRN